jgi:hypothetical protein
MKNRISSNIRIESSGFVYSGDVVYSNKPRKSIFFYGSQLESKKFTINISGISLGLNNDFQTEVSSIEDIFFLLSKLNFNKDISKQLCG